MKRPGPDVALLDLFRQEVDAQAQLLTDSLLAVERNEAVADQLEAGMRAAHSLKGAARVIGLTAGVRISAAIENCFVAAQRGQVALLHPQIDRLLAAVDLLKRIAVVSESDFDAWEDEGSLEVAACIAQLEAVLGGCDAAAPQAIAPSSPAESVDDRDASDRVLRVTAESLNRLLGLAGESLVESLWVKPFGFDSMHHHRDSQ